MGWRVTLVLSALLLIVAAYAYFDAISGEQDVSLQSLLRELRPTPPGQDAPSLLRYEPTEITGIRIRRGDLDLHVQRRNGKWINASRPDALDDLLVNLLTLSEIMTTEVAKQDLADHGLDPPQAVVDLERADGDTISVRIGNRNPPATAVYVQVGPSEHVTLTGALMLWEVEKAIDAATPQHHPRDGLTAAGAAPHRDSAVSRGRDSDEDCPLRRTPRPASPDGPNRGKR
jgi:hypothetical protein